MEHIIDCIISNITDTAGTDEELSRQQLTLKLADTLSFQLGLSIKINTGIVTPNRRQHRLSVDQCPNAPSSHSRGHHAFTVAEHPKNPKRPNIPNMGHPLER